MSPHVGPGATDGHRRGIGDDSIGAAQQRAGVDDRATRVRVAGVRQNKCAVASFGDAAAKQSVRGQGFRVSGLESGRTADGSFFAIGVSAALATRPMAMGPAGSLASRGQIFPATMRPTPNDGVNDESSVALCGQLFLLHPLQLFRCVFMSHHYPLGDQQADHQAKEKNRDDILHGLQPFPRVDAMGENDHSHSHPKAEDARHPDANKEPILMADEKPE